MTEALSGVTVVIIIGLGVLTFLLLFIFAKRQIMRFALRSTRGPHIPIGHDASKVLRRNIETYIDIIQRISCEPLLLSVNNSRYIVCPTQQVSNHYYRLKAVDDIKLLEKEITKQDKDLVRQPNENLRAYLLSTLAAPLNGSGQRLIHQFCDLYEHARHDPNNFMEDEYQTYSRLLLKLIDAAKMLKSFNSRRSSPNRTPQRFKEKNRNMLDPSKLTPFRGFFSVPENNETNSDYTETRTVSMGVTTTSGENESTNTT
ncbi:protein C1orf43 homolog isoform X1 [Onthophagus taurus]|uniref:protein C1orf43 homolog isoform X1 n=2 Tax=Onthophagus taurus TaxID=166361 RepID=UPI0039BDB20A